ncbi:SGNH/GDSL hydrolase family protein [Glaciecola petra]|uniref:SGNH hydrolase-type esterase domain-containing protein n=1 Tax=Glaciecola petra TaxID=3075602 RepID=A0ABU2ZSQ4_9ALTE|nr:SGNH/GDSL hydrolase family protein [Aestuariibacter sp. P117]MDT0594457.1 hypothetical protein [Aestuariibacter sp. P117]
MKAKKFLFYAIACLLPFVIIALLELSLRIFSYGKVYPLFVPSEQFNQYVQPNPELIKRYFPATENIPRVAPDTFLFKHNKEKDTLRIVTMGGSTMAGFPYGRFGSVAGMLKQRIKASQPELEVEIISVAMSSINTYTLLDITDEVIAIEPDIVLIYTGHNEYLGVMGVGSIYAGSGGHASNLLFLKLKEFRLYQLIQNFYHRFVSKKKQTDNLNQQNPIDAQRTVMAQVAKNKAIIYNDETFTAGVHQFEQNLSMILAAFNSAEIPVFLSTLVANEKDQAPFASAAANRSQTNDKTRLSELSESLKRKSTPVRQDDIAIAESAKYADYFYQLAERFYHSNDVKSAHGYYVKALDYDVLRFRAPSRFNTIIRKLSADFNVKLVDSYAFMHGQTSDGIIGNSLMLEHLHPNKKGYFLLAEAFFQALNKYKVLSSSYVIKTDDAFKTNPLTKADEIYANYKIAQLTSDYPFVDRKKPVPFPKATDPVNSIAISRIKGTSWIETQKTLLDYYQSSREFERAANIAGILYDAIPEQTDMARLASLLYLRADKLPLAKYYALRASAEKPNNTNYRLSLAEVFFKLGDTQRTIEELDQVIKMEPNNKRAKDIRASVKP